MDSVIDIQAHVAAGERSAIETVEESLAAIEASNPIHQAVLRVDADRARAKAADIDARRRQGTTLGTLAGVPVLLKDNICTSWGLTTCGSLMLQNYRSPYDATVVQRLEQADAVIVGKTNLDEFAMGSSTENSAFGPVRNPWNTHCVPGGSSGGSAAAVAAGCVPVALGSDTGGSIRQPAAFCNVVGFKPGYGRVSRYGLVAFGSSLDQIGPLTHTVADTARVLRVIAGSDRNDSTCLDETVPDYDAALEKTSGDLRIGVAPEAFGEGLDPEVKAAVELAIETYRSHGARIVDVHLPHLSHAVACYYIVCTAEASSNLARFDGVHYGHRSAASEVIDLYERSRAEGFGDEVKRRIMLGTYALSSGYYDAYYLKALKVRTLIKRDFERAFEQADVVLTPTSPVPPFRVGERVDDPLALYLADVYTAPANLAGIPAVSVPCGFTAAGLPIGMQLQAPVLGESGLLAAAGMYQSWTDWHTRRPEG